MSYQDREVPERHDRLLEALERFQRPAEDLYHRHGAHVLHNRRVHPLEGGVIVAIALLGLLAHHHRRQEHAERHGEGNERRDREAPIHDKEEDDHHDGKHNCGDDIRNVVGHEELDSLNVVGQDLLDLAARAPGKEPHGEPGELFGDLDPDLVEDVERRDMRQHRRAVEDDPVRPDRGETDVPQAVEELPVQVRDIRRVGGELAQNEVDDYRRDELGSGRDNREGHRGEKPPPLRTGDLHEAAEALLSLKIGVGVRVRAGRCAGGDFRVHE
ncbi:hypothetical protein L21SP2_0362 [Salinispira pacifica]|uniref:Uncharacterized protein n=1 Tax=Salinispira pacifica TaxID=1307761 RepID=V5WD94_9SPIO|nr:hypothetical protein L21SP2_0362 [Salinispira pacifica]